MRGWVLLASLLAACGGPAPSTTPEPALVAAPATGGGEERCGEDAAPVGASCFSVVGTRWWFVTDLPVGGHREFELVLHPGGRAQVGDENDTTPDNDRWVLDGRTLTITMNDGFVSYATTITSAQELRGRGLNVREQKWDFVATRMQ